MTPIRWLLGGRGLAMLAADPRASMLLQGSRPLVIVGKAVDAVPAGWGAVPVASFTSYRALERVVRDGSMRPDVRAVLYDNERWRFTPLDEQRDPATFVREAAQIAHERHLTFISAPAVNIVRSMGRDGPAYDAYLAANLPADSARNADVYDIQAQGSERNTQRYAWFVREAAAQARRANRRVIVLAGLSTNPSGQHVTADDIIAAIQATRSAVDGYWLNIPARSPYCPRCDQFRPDLVVDVLQRLKAGDT